MYTEQNQFASNAITRNAKPINIYQLMQDAYNSTGGYLNGGYIVKHKRETAEDFRIRTEVTPYRNYYKPIIDALYKPVFDGTIKREFVRTDDVLETFLQDADTKDNSLDTVMRWAAKDACIYGCMLAVLDNFGGLSEREIDNVEDRRLPYIYTVRPDRIKSVFLTETGQMFAICYKEHIEDEDGKSEIFYRTWTTEYSYLTVSAITTPKELSSIEPVEVVEHFLGKLPCNFVYSEGAGDAVIIPPKFISAAMLNDSVYQLGSEIREYERKFVFPIFTVQGKLNFERQPQGVVDPATGLAAEVNKPTYKIGSDKVLQYDADVSNSPQWLTVSVDGLREMRADMQETVKELESWSGRGEADALSVSASAETRKIFFNITSSDKVELSQELERFESWLFKIFGLWTNQDEDYYGASVDYPKSFGVDDIFGEIELFKMQMELFADSPTVRSEILKRAVDVVFSKWTNQEREVLYAMLENDLASAVESNIAILNGDT